MGTIAFEATLLIKPPTLSVVSIFDSRQLIPLLTQAIMSKKSLVIIGALICVVIVALVTKTILSRYQSHGTGKVEGNILSTNALDNTQSSNLVNSISAPDNLSEYLIKLTDDPIQKKRSSVVIASKESATLAVQEVAKDFLSPQVLRGTVFDAGVGALPLLDGYAVQITSLFTENPKGEPAPERNDFFVAKDGTVFFLAKLTEFPSDPEKGTYSGTGRYWDWKKVLAEQYEFRLTELIKGTDIVSEKWATEQCQQSFGKDWVWTEFHMNGENAGNFPTNGVFGGRTHTDKAWVWINDQNWECYEGGKPSLGNKVNYRDLYNGGFVGALQYSDKYISIKWFGETYGTNYALCASSLPLLCMKSKDRAFYPSYQRMMDQAGQQRAQTQVSQDPSVLEAAQKATKEKNLSLCETPFIPYSTDKMLDCQNLALDSIKASSIDICKTTGTYDLRLKDACYTSIAFKTNNISFCSYIEENSGGSQLPLCFKNILKKDPQLKGCDPVGDSMKRELCLIEYAKLTGDRNACSEVEFGLYQYDCYTALAIFHKDQQLCEPIQYQKEKCVEQVRRLLSN